MAHKPEDISDFKVDRPVAAARAFDNFSTTGVGENEIVLLDNERLTYHTLNGPAYAVWQLCDGRRTIDEISRELAVGDSPLPVDVVQLAVAELDEAGLLVTEVAITTAHVSRRRVLQMAAAGAIGAGLIPAVSSITAPSALASLSSCNPGDNLPPESLCACSAECASNCCRAVGGTQRCKSGGGQCIPPGN